MAVNIKELEKIFFERGAEIEQLKKRVKELEGRLDEASTRLKLLHALEQAGVDNWSGYEYALKIFCE